MFTRIFSNFAVLYTDLKTVGEPTTDENPASACLCIDCISTCESCQVSRSSKRVRKWLQLNHIVSFGDVFAILLRAATALKVSALKMSISRSLSLAFIDMVLRYE